MAVTVTGYVRSSIQIAIEAYSHIQTTAQYWIDHYQSKIDAERRQSSPNLARITEFENRQVEFQQQIERAIVSQVDTTIVWLETYRR